MSNLVHRLRFFLCAGLCSVLLSSTAHADLTQRDEVREFIARMDQEHGFPSTELEALFRQVELRADIIRAISRPAEAKPWHQYRPIFLTEDRIQKGVAFWHNHADILARAEAAYGVPAEMIVAILGVETRYGSYMGSHRVIDALATLAFDYPPRAAFFGRELEQFLLMTREEAFDPLSLKGSYAGAMGKAQFIPSSFRHYAVDFSGDGRRDLWESVEDAAGSIANYFKRHGWEPGAPVAFPARVRGDGFGRAVKAGIKPGFSVGELRGMGVDFDGELADDTRAALLELEGADGPEYWVIPNNFYVITRYNHSALYGMAVHQLSSAIRAAYEGRS